MTRSGRFILILAALAFGGAAFGAEDSAEAVCRNHLEQLGAAIRAYRMIYDGKDPSKLSDLYYGGLVDELGIFVCPASGATLADRTKIDADTDYTMEPLANAKGMLIREKVSHHEPGQVLVAFVDGSVKLVPIPGAAVAPKAASAAPAVPAPVSSSRRMEWGAIGLLVAVGLAAWIRLKGLGAVLSTLGKLAGAALTLLFATARRLRGPLRSLAIQAGRFLAWALKGLFAGAVRLGTKLAAVCREKMRAYRAAAPSPAAAPTELRCPSPGCARVAPKGDKFCGLCGAPLSGHAPQSSTA